MSDNETGAPTPPADEPEALDPAAGIGDTAPGDAGDPTSPAWVPPPAPEVAPLAAQLFAPPDAAPAPGAEPVPSASPVPDPVSEPPAAEPPAVAAAPPFEPAPGPAPAPEPVAPAPPPAIFEPVAPVPAPPVPVEAAAPAPEAEPAGPAPTVQPPAPPLSVRPTIPLPGQAPAVVEPPAAAPAPVEPATPPMSPGPAAPMPAAVPAPPVAPVPVASAPAPEPPAMPAPPAVAAPAPPAAAVPPPVASVPPPPSAVLAGPGGSGEVQPEAGDFAVATMPEADELVPVAEAVSEVPFDSDGTWASSGRGSMSKRSMSKRSLSMPSLSLGEGRSRVVIAIVVVIALALAALAYLFLRPGSGNTAVAMTMSFTKSERQTYHMTMDLHGSLTAAGQQVPLSEQMDMVMTWKVTDVNAAGVATVDVGVRHATATVDGRKVKVPSLGHLRFQINQNGQIVSGNMMALTSASGSAGSGVPGTDQLTPLLPDHPVKPGDSWSKTYSQPNPFGDGSITYTTETHYVSNQMMQGVNAAVLQSTTTVPLNMTIDVRKMLKSAGSDATGSLDGADPKFTYKGSVTMNQTAWFDVPNKQMLATQVQGHFDLHMSVSGLPAGESFPGGEIGFTGDLTMSLTRTSGSGSASPGPDAGSSGSAT